MAPFDDLTPATARRKLDKLVDRYGGRAVFDAHDERLTETTRRLMDDLEPPGQPRELREIVEIIGREEFERKTMGSDDQGARGIEETPEGTARMQEAGLSAGGDSYETNVDIALYDTRDVHAKRGPDGMEYDFTSQGIGFDLRQEALEAAREQYGDPSTHSPGEYVGAVAFKGAGTPQARFVGTTPPQQPTEESAPDNFSPLEPQEIDDSPSNQRQQATLGDPQPNTDPEPFPTEPDEATRRAMAERNTEQMGLGGISRDESARATDDARRNQRRQEARAEQDRPRDQMTLQESGEQSTSRLDDFEGTGGDRGN